MPSAIALIIWAAEQLPAGAATRTSGRRKQFQDRAAGSLGPPVNRVSVSPRGQDQSWHRVQLQSPAGAAATCPVPDPTPSDAARDPYSTIGVGPDLSPAHHGILYGIGRGADPHDLKNANRLPASACEAGQRGQVSAPLSVFTRRRTGHPVSSLRRRHRCSPAPHQKMRACLGAGHRRDHQTLVLNGLLAARPAEATPNCSPLRDVACHQLYAGR